jgi:hypothetical protein
MYPLTHIHCVPVQYWFGPHWFEVWQTPFTKTCPEAHR